MLLTTLTYSQARDEIYVVPAGRKASSIIIPSIEFRSTTFADGIEFLRQESVRLDAEPDVTLRGVNIYVKMAAARSFCRAARWTFLLSNAPRCIVTAHTHVA